MSEGAAASAGPAKAPSPPKAAQSDDTGPIQDSTRQSKHPARIRGSVGRMLASANTESKVNEQGRLPPLRKTRPHTRKRRAELTQRLRSRSSIIFGGRARETAGYRCRRRTLSRRFSHRATQEALTGQVNQSDPAGRHTRSFPKLGYVLVAAS